MAFTRVRREYLKNKDITGASIIPEFKLYSEISSYSEGDIVQWKNSLYKIKIGKSVSPKGEGDLSSAPDIDTTNWELLINLENLYDIFQLKDIVTVGINGDYPTVYDAIQDGKFNLRLISDVTDTNTILLDNYKIIIVNGNNHKWTLERLEWSGYGIFYASNITIQNYSSTAIFQSNWGYYYWDKVVFELNGNVEITDSTSGQYPNINASQLTIDTSNGRCSRLFYLKNIDSLYLIDGGLDNSILVYYGVIGYLKILGTPSINKAIRLQYSKVDYIDGKDHIISLEYNNIINGGSFKIMGWDNKTIINNAIITSVDYYTSSNLIFNNCEISNLLNRSYSVSFLFSNCKINQDLTIGNLHSVTINNETYITGYCIINSNKNKIANCQIDKKLTIAGSNNIIIGNEINEIDQTGIELTSISQNNIVADNIIHGDTIDNGTNNSINNLNII